MRICVLHLGDICDCLVASSINRGFLYKYGNCDITWVVQGEDQSSLFKYTPNVRSVLMSHFMRQPKEDFDLLVNLSPTIHPADPVVSAKELLGFSFKENSAEFYDILHGNRRTQMNIFQVYFKLAGLIWRGEGYGVNYYPRSKVRRNSVAISVDHAKLRHYVIDNLSVDTIRTMLIPYKKNIFRRMDEINRCTSVITDDQLTMHLGLFLRKYVHFLEAIPMNTQPIFFGQGYVYTVPSKIVK